MPGAAGFWSFAHRRAQPVEPRRGQDARLGFGEQQIEADGARLRRRQPRQGIRHDRAAPRPSTDLPDALVVDQHQHDVVGRWRGRA